MRRAIIQQPGKHLIVAYPAAVFFASADASDSTWRCVPRKRASVIALLKAANSCGAVNESVRVFYATVVVQSTSAVVITVLLGSPCLEVPPMSMPAMCTLLAPPNILSAMAINRFLWMPLAYAIQYRGLIFVPRYCAGCYAMIELRGCAHA